MAANGEERLLTLFGDVHYYFTEPGPRPVQHRFDKESYIYLYRDTAQRRGRLEIANHAGTPEQDAFTGYLDNAKISQSHRHPTLVTLVVDGAPSRQAVPQPSEQNWRLPSTDPRDEGKYLFRLHTIDLYFWTVEDARMFIASAQQTLRQDQFNVDLPPPPAAHSQSPASYQQQQQHAHQGGAMSPVVQNLENVAISDPAYQGHQSRSGSTAAHVGGSGRQSGAPQAEHRADQDYTPLAYNPSAPPPPEEIKHREKTPPPPDAVGGTGLTQAAYADHAQQHPQGPGFTNVPPPPPPGQQASYNPAAPHGYPASPPPGPGSAGTSQSGSHRQSVASQTYVPSSATQATSPTPSASAQQRYVPTGVDPATYRAAQDPAKQPMDSPTAEILGGLVGPDGRRQPVTHLQPQYADYLSSRPHSQSPQGQGYSAPAQQQGQPLQQHASQHSQHHHHHHSGSAGQQAAQQPYWQTNPYGTGDPSMHSQVYVPGDGEAGAWGTKPGRSSSAAAQGGQQGNNRRWEGRAEKAEKGLNKLLKKVEKKIG